MLADDDAIDVITTYANISLESIQDEEASASSSTSRLKKYLDSVYEDLGTSSAIFNANSGSTALTYSIKKDISLMYAWSHQYELAINSFLRKKAKSGQLYFSIKVLPTSSIFRKEDIDTYLKTAQYGYPKTMVGALIGLDAIELEQVSDFENNVLKLSNSMIPLSSSYTATTNSSEEKNTNTTPSNDISVEGGRPQKSVEERTDKTERNLDGAT